MAISKLSTSASLKQVMDKFEEISIQDFSKSNIDIITAKTLPSVVKEGQIVIITQNTPNKIYVSFDTKEISLSNNDILLQVSNKTTNKRPLYCGDKEISLVYSSCVQNKKYLESYYGENGEWVQITYTDTYILRNGVSEWGNFLLVKGTTYGEILGNGSLNLKTNGTWSPPYAYISNNRCLDLSKYSKLTVKISSMVLPPKQSSQNDINNYIEFGIASTDDGYGQFYVKKNYTNTTTSKTYTNLVIELDISNIDLGFFVLKGAYQGTSSYNEIHITDIYMN